MSGGGRRGGLGQEQIILAIAVMVFGILSLLVPGFLSAGNVVAMVQSVSVLGVFGLGMAITILGRGIDLSMVASMSVSIAWMLVQLNAGVPLAQALSMAIGFSVLIGIINGVLAAYVEIPAIFAKLAMGVTVYGFGKFFRAESGVNFLPEAWRWLIWRRPGHWACRSRLSCFWPVRFWRIWRRAICGMAGSSMRWATIRWRRGRRG